MRWPSIDVVSAEWFVARYSEERLEKAPAVGTIAFAKTDSNARETWLLFEPALAYFNGYDERPDDLVACAVVHAIRQSKAASNGISELEVIEVVEVREFGTRWPLRSCDSLGLLGESAAELDLIEAGDLQHLSYNAQGDWGAWLIARHVDGHVFALLCGEWSVGGHERIFAGNAEIPRKRWEAVLARVGGG